MITRIDIRDIRNIKEETVLFDDTATGFFGDNGSGKTSILESLMLLIFGRSLREAEARDVVRQGADFGQIAGIVAGEDRTCTVTAFPRALTTMRVEGQVASRNTYIGKQSIVAFMPSDAFMFFSAPEKRRLWMNRVLAQAESTYAHALHEYALIIKQRNAVLKRIRDREGGTMDELAVFDDMITPHGITLIAHRRTLIETYEKRLSEAYIGMGGKEDVSWKIAGSTSAVHEDDSAYEAELQSRHERDIILGQTTFGPHRQDLTLMLGQHEAETRMSQGEMRTLILALKRIEMDILQRTVKPIVLLDDVFSELDEAHQGHLQEMVQGYQTVVTTTEEAHLHRMGIKKRYRVSSGGIFSVE